MRDAALQITIIQMGRFHQHLVICFPHEAKGLGSEIFRPLICNVAKDWSAIKERINGYGGEFTRGDAGKGRALLGKGGLVSQRNGVHAGAAQRDHFAQFALRKRSSVR